MSQNHNELKSSTLGPTNHFFFKVFYRLRIIFCFTIHKKLNKSCSLDKLFLFLKKKIVSLKKTLKKKIVTGTHRGGFQFIVILTPWGVPFHPVVVIGLGKNLLFKTILAHCGFITENYLLDTLFLNLFPIFTVHAVSFT